MKRDASSPIVATVLVIAVTLIATIAVGGFVFGVFSEGQNSAQIAVTGTNLSAAYFSTAGSSRTFTCPETAAANYLTATNTGTSAGSIITVSIVWAGSATTYSGLCSVGPSGTLQSSKVIFFPASSTIQTNPIVGQTYSGVVTLSSGAQILFTGSWR